MTSKQEVFSLVFIFLVAIGISYGVGGTSGYNKGVEDGYQVGFNEGFAAASEDKEAPKLTLEHKDVKAKAK